jgi:cyclopropane fatty-acyl-phospholipid synthase-like methyltransferase
MPINILKIKDQCRKNLSRFTERALSSIPELDNPIILDIGCGTGIPTILLAEKYKGTVYAVDIDAPSLEVLEEKIENQIFHSKTVVLNDSLLNLSKFKLKFNIILAEGVLNVVGFNRGLRIFLENLKNPGYLIIHDEYQNDSQKRMRFNKNQLDLVASFKLDKNIWWNEYYSCLEKKIDEIGNNSLFHKEINEINEYKINPEKFESIFYVLKNRI